MMFAVAHAHVLIIQFGENQYYIGTSFIMLDDKRTTTSRWQYLYVISFFFLNIINYRLPF